MLENVLLIPSHPAWRLGVMVEQSLDNYSTQLRPYGS